MSFVTANGGGAGTANTNDPEKVTPSAAVVISIRARHYLRTLFGFGGGSEWMKSMMRKAVERRCHHPTMWIVPSDPSSEGQLLSRELRTVADLSAAKQRERAAGPAMSLWQ